MSDKPEKVRVFAVNTRFQQMARRPGGVPRDIAIAQAQSQIEEYKADFVDWVERELQELSDAFYSAKGDNIEEARIDAMYRLCCQLRDTGTTMGLALLTFVSDNLCRVLEAIRSGAPYDPAMIECHLDALTLARKEPYRSMSPDHFPDMTSGLKRVLDRANRYLTQD
jgi:chemotaxis protein histidine kinase CheA